MRSLLDAIRVASVFQFPKRARINTNSICNIFGSCARPVTRSQSNARACLGGASMGARLLEFNMEENVNDSFKVTLESLYTNKISEISYDEEETLQE